MMKNFTKQEAIEQMNRWGAERKPFLFIIDYAMERNHIIALEEVDPTRVRYDFNGVNNISQTDTDTEPEAESGKPIWEAYPVSFEDYLHKFTIVLNGLKRGDSFLTNLTERTPIRCNLSLRRLFDISRAKYRLWVKDRFCALSPEIFVQIRAGRIASFPMKGTIDADLPDAGHRILADVKEAAEHATIVDLIRNDLSMYASEVEVKRYRYIDRLETHKGALLQVSSEITGILPDDYHRHLGQILYAMLPAGSICGAPKKRTCEIIAEAEGAGRGYYTGIAGIFDGENIDSGVLIRFIEQDEAGNYYFRSGGGITAKSDARSEYEELIQKIYVPVCRNNQNQ